MADRVWSAYIVCSMPKLHPYIELTKPRITTMVVVMAALGFFLGAHGNVSLVPMLWTLLGTAMVSAGSAALNHYLERDVDALMHRTKARPLPSGELTSAATLSFGFGLILVGQILLVVLVNLLTAWLALLTAFLYVVIYTPMKRMTWLNTSLGAIPGALPPVGGWVAASGEIELGAWALFAILFTWQHPHFYSIAWIFRDDYRRAGFRMLPCVESEGYPRTCRQIIGFSVLLLAASMLPAFLGISGTVYIVGATALGLGMLGASVSLVTQRDHLQARRLLRTSVIYLPLLFLLTVIDLSL
ncbi:MAG: protoheme IX farnesyltransferase [Gemmatimonadetes bacterium]|nr:protoheme IX farnesyltransferase [Gemmatimonadota bacterium]